MEDFMKRKVEFAIEQNKMFTVTVVAWSSKKYDSDFKEVIGEMWHWNVYAYIYPTNPLYLNPEQAKDLPFHCGCTYDKYDIVAPTSFKYDWQKITSCLVLGSDYAHICDDHENHASPFDEGIPYYVKRDALELVAALTDNQGDSK